MKRGKVGLSDEKGRREESMVTAIYEALILKRGIVTSCTTRYVDMSTHLINLHLWVEVNIR